MDSYRRKYVQVEGGTQKGRMYILQASHCQKCGKELDDLLYDARTWGGKWGYFCSQCFDAHCPGLGIGRGQKYKGYKLFMFNRSQWDLWLSIKADEVERANTYGTFWEPTDDVTEYDCLFCAVFGQDCDSCVVGLDTVQFTNNHPDKQSELRINLYCLSHGKSKIDKAIERLYKAGVFNRVDDKAEFGHFVKKFNAGWYDPPAFDHDCNSCIYLGRHYETESDLYFCGNEKRHTVIARYSSEGSDYSSGIYSAENILELKEAKTRAIEKGLIF